MAGAAATPLACHVYVSEGRRWPAVERVTRAAMAAGARSPRNVFLARTFPDVDYNRTCFTFVADDPAELGTAVASVAQVAAEVVDMREQEARHPRLGVLDHVSVHPLGTSGADGMADASVAARNIAARLGDDVGLPYYLYGAASATGDVRLAAIRRALGYFSGEAHGKWQGVGTGAKDAPLAADGGPAEPHEARGIVCVGATAWVTHVNVPLVSADNDVGTLLTRARSIARAVAERHGGLTGVEAMALPKHTPPLPPRLGDASQDLEALRSSVEAALASHAEHASVVEVACNVRLPDVTPPSSVVAAVLAHASSAGLAAHPVGAYETQAGPASLLAEARRRLLS